MIKNRHIFLFNEYGKKKKNKMKKKNQKINDNNNCTMYIVLII